MKTILSITSQNLAAWFSVLLRLDKHKIFARTCIDYLRKYNFDGLELDIQFQKFTQYDSEDFVENIIPFVRTIYTEFVKESNVTGKEKLSFSMVLQGIPSQFFEPSKISIFLDWVTINTYKYHSINEKYVSHVSSLFSDDNLNVNYSMNYYITSGIPPKKLVMSIPLFGHSYTLEDPLKHGFKSPAVRPGEKGSSTQEIGILSYYEICQNFLFHDWEVVKPKPTEMGPYSHKGDQWVGYDDEEMVRFKGQYAQNLGLGGISFWSLDLDDFLGKCGKTYPLIRAAVEGYKMEKMVHHIDVGDLLFKK